MDFLVKELNIKFNFNDLEEYFLKINKNFNHLKWTSELRESTNGYENHSINDIYGWGIQSNLNNLNIPCPPYNIHKESTEIYQDTVMVFGFAEKLKLQIPYLRQLSIAAHPPGTKINLHLDTNTYNKVHIPIVTDKNAFFYFENERFVLEKGKIYLVNTSKKHGTVHYGKNDRIHLFFKVPVDKINELLMVNEI